MTSAPQRSIDLNADLGESFGAWRMGDDQALLDVVSSANVACGFHAGDPSVMLQTCRLAAERGVAVGAHVAYRDLAGFGRSFLDLPPAQLRDEVLYQLGALSTIALAAGTTVTYVKPHGALYNTIVAHEAQATAVVDALEMFSSTRPEPITLLGLPGAVVLDLAVARGLPIAREAFADRGYTAQGTLVSRREPGAVLHDAAAVAQRMVQLVTTGRITAVDGSEVTVSADSICVHGDSPGAVAMAVEVRRALAGAGITLRAFA
ncbi:MULTISPECIES: LamB/YcsF family protein [unclassified Luteococcus]|uniref:LamB/YcsF family protein n=1 Tax=unclassified Luteococcus TaxID=2639923 RepID=UPI00313D3228